jgi:hypothetical protein
MHDATPSLRGVRTTAAPHHRQIEQQPHGERSRQVPRQADMSMSMPIDRVNSVFLLQSAAEPLVTERDDHLPEKISWQKSEFNGQKPVELNHFNHGKMYYPVNLPSAKTRLVHKDFHFQLGVRGNGQVSVVKQPQHDQKSLEKDFSTVTRHTAESRRPHRKKKKSRGFAKNKPPRGGTNPPGNNHHQFPGSFSSWTRADGLCLELGGEANKNRFFRAVPRPSVIPNLKLSVNNSPISRRANEKEGRSLWKALRLGAFCEPLFCQCANSLTRTPQVSKNRRGPCSHRPLFPNPPHAGRHQSRSRPSAENDL